MAARVGIREDVQLEKVGERRCPSDRCASLIEARVAEQSVKTKVALRADFPATGRSITRETLEEFSDDISNDFHRVGAVDCAIFGLAERQPPTAEKGVHAGPEVEPDKSRDLRVAVEFSVSDEDLMFEHPATMVVRGTDLIVVDGIFDQIREKLEAANQAPTRLPAVDGTVIFMSWLLGLALASYIVVLSSPEPKSSTIELSTLGYFAVAGIPLLLVLLLIYRWLTVPTEFLGEGQRPRWERSRRLVLGATGAFVISLVAGLALFLF
jgi:hypothetical protein